MPVQDTIQLRSIATATPDHVIRQDDAITLAEHFFSEQIDDFDRMKPVFCNSGISQRHAAMPLEWYREPHDWPERTNVYLKVATRLFEKAARAALDKASLKASEINAVVTVSSTGIATPTLDARAADALGFRPDILRVPLFGLGCAGGTTGLALAARIARSEPGTRVLVVALELCTIAFRPDKFSKANIVATALFGDGAAAAIVSSETGDAKIEIGRGCQHTWPDTLGIMGWKVDPTGFEVIFDRAIPPFARTHLRPAVDGFLQTLGIEPVELSRLCFHPGGMKVLEAIEAAFELQKGALDIERDVLHDYGNMSAPTVLFVLERFLKTGMRGTSLLTALGPGFTASSVPVKVLQ